MRAVADATGTDQLTLAITLMYNISLVLKGVMDEDDSMKNILSKTLRAEIEEADEELEEFLGDWAKKGE